MMWLRKECFLKRLKRNLGSWCVCGAGGRVLFMPVQCPSQREDGLTGVLVGVTVSLPRRGSGTVSVCHVPFLCSGDIPGEAALSPTPAPRPQWTCNMGER